MMCDYQFRKKAQPFTLQQALQCVFRVLIHSTMNMPTLPKSSRPRGFRVVSRALCGNPDQPNQFAESNNDVANGTFASGIQAGQYQAPHFEFIFA
jgi:hypothetical protein